MKRNKLFRITFVVLMVIIALNVYIFYAYIPVSNAQQNEEKTNNIEDKTENINPENLFEGEDIINLSDAISIVEYAQDKISKRVNYETSLDAIFNINMNMLNLPIQIKTKTSVNADGVYYTTDACNMYKEWLQGQKGFCFYGKYNSDNVYLRWTYDVTYDTCVPIFKGDFHKNSYKEAINENGIINYANLVNINNGSVLKVEEFKEENEVFTIKLKIKKDKLPELQQKTYKWAYLVKKPNVLSFDVTYKIDKYGNFIDAKYDFSCYGTRDTQLGRISGTIEGSFTQKYSYTNNVDFPIPTAIKF